MSKINDILVRLADIEIGITVPGEPIPYILQAEPYQPSDLSSVSCPFFVNEVVIGGNSADIPIASGMQYRMTTFNLMLCLARYEANIDLKYGIQTTVEWADAVMSTFAQHVRLSAPSKTIVSSTNASPINVAVAAPHRYSTGDAVTISNHLVNTAANGAWIVTVVDELNFTLNGSTGNGVGAQTGTARLTQPSDMVDHIVDVAISEWALVPYEYGSGKFLALKFPLRVREMFVTTIAA